MTLSHITLFKGDVSVKAATTHDAAPFYDFIYAFPRVTRAYATSLPGDSINIGFSKDGISIAYALDLAVNEKLIASLSSSSEDRYGVRCSTNSTTGTASMVVDFIKGDYPTE